MDVRPRLVARLTELRDLREKAIAQVHAFTGAIQLAEQLVAEIEGNGVDHSAEAITDADLA